ncbi:amidohydrolase [Arthrobacter sp. RIT-PI-e]|uniref:amidohydrolase n=1 Tax=Arthrobacter sp. RIT-PI-e TaxID=1681197 RepID=UPI00067612E5|nr:amidohydrolase [Arthrobacter sp. RIT-PI-e]KNC17839.1 amidohydrolase [Arthrobacter sp. RIT-PI-e]
MTGADIIVTNAVVRTMDPHRPRATAFAIGGGRVLRGGSDEDVRDLAGEGTEVVDLAGAAVIPGLVDVHNHHLMAGEADLYQLGFSPTAGFDEVIEAVRDYSAGLAADAWVIGEAFGSVLIEDFSHVSARYRLDEAAGGRPVALTDDSHHNRFASTRALELAGITADTPDPDKGHIVRDPDTGEPTGLLLESATISLTEAVDAGLQRTPERYREASRRALEILHSFGITAFQDAAATVEIMGALRELDEAGELHAWVSSCMLSSGFLFANTPFGEELVVRGEEFRTEHHRPDFVKVALDGVPPTYTGAFLTPYLDSAEHGHGHCGVTTMDPQELRAWLLWTAERGLGAKIHCTGDASVRVALDAIDAVRSAGHTEQRYHIAHGQFVHPQDRARFSSLDVAADISPYLWFPGVIPDAIAAVRPAEQAAQLQPNRDLLDLGVLVAGGSDWPVSVSPNPWEGIQGLVTRADPLGRAPGTLWIEQAVSLEEALEIFTINGARAMGLDDVTGSLTVGKSADFAVLSMDPFTVPADRIVDTYATETWFAGRRVHTHPVTS